MPEPRRLPDPTTWRYVMVHPVIRHGSPITVSNYRSSTSSFLSIHHGEAKPTVVFSDPYLRDRLWRLGWIDVTPEVGSHTVKLWDEERGRWRLDQEGFLPWERRPGEKTEPLPVEEVSVEEEPVEAVEIEGSDPRPAPKKREPRGAAAQGHEAPVPAPSPAKGKGPSVRPIGG